jgi:GntR family transcriptional regulator
MTDQRVTILNQPLYLQVEATLKEMIEGVVYSPGDQIPSERELSEQLGVSRMTVRRAIENLIRRGLLERRSTNGTYVRQPQVLRRVGKDFAMGLTQLLIQEGVTPGSRLISFQVTLAPLKIAEKLGLRVGAPVIVLRRVRLANDTPFCVETSYLPADLLPGLQAEDFVHNASLYDILRQRYNVMMVKNDETLKLSFATPDEADLLELKPGSPVLLLRCVVMDQNDRRMEYLVSVNHPERVIFHSMTSLMSL